MSFASKIAESDSNWLWSIKWWPIHIPCTILTNLFYIFPEIRQTPFAPPTFGLNLPSQKLNSSLIVLIIVAYKSPTTITVYRVLVYNTLRRIRPSVSVNQSLSPPTSLSRTQCAEHRTSNSIRAAVGEHLSAAHSVLKAGRYNELERRCSTMLATRWNTMTWWAHKYCNTVRERDSVCYEATRIA